MPDSLRCENAGLPRSFFARHADVVAPALIGAILVRQLQDRILRARIVETEAYLGPGDLASHASKGRTARTEVMFGPAGHAYVYLIYGIHQMLNIVVSKPGEAHAVLLRAAEPLDEWDAPLSGPGRLAKAFAISRKDNGLDLTGDTLWVCGGGSVAKDIVISPRVGVDYAGIWKDKLLRFSLKGSPWVSKPRPAVT